MSTGLPMVWDPSSACKAMRLALQMTDSPSAPSRGQLQKANTHGRVTPWPASLRWATRRCLGLRKVFVQCGEAGGHWSSETGKERMPLSGSKVTGQEPTPDLLLQIGGPLYPTRGRWLSGRRGEEDAGVTTSDRTEGWQTKAQRPWHCFPGGKHGHSSVFPGRWSRLGLTSGDRSELEEVGLPHMWDTWSPAGSTCVSLLLREAPPHTGSTGY